MDAVENAAGNYIFLPGIEPFSSGAAAMPGHEVVHGVLRTPVPWRQGFALIDRHLNAAGRPRQALCGIELRCPAPMSLDGFAEFNAGYRELLSDWEILLDDINPVARTNVSPVVGPPDETLLYGFSYTVPAEDTPRTFVGAGGGETTGGGLGGIVREGDTSAGAMAAKSARVMEIMQARLSGLGMDWGDVTAVNVYTAVTDASYLAAQLVEKIGAHAVHGVHWYLSRPPIVGLDFEMDLRGYRQKLWLDT
ncbi:MAG: RidA family protein [Alphaproteobacteria bacterium]|jgi:hypothetical protein|nr:RidA family protein [Alphaproteobacteria bacterium]